MAVDEAEAAADVQRTDVLEAAQPLARQTEQRPRLRLEEDVVLVPRERDRRLDLLLVRPAIAVERAGYGERSSWRPAATDRLRAGEKPRVSWTRYRGRALTSS